MATISFEKAHILDAIESLGQARATQIHEHLRLRGLKISKSEVVDRLVELQNSQLVIPVAGGSYPIYDVTSKGQQIWMDDPGGYGIGDFR